MTIAGLLDDESPFRIAEVRRSALITPQMRRITFCGAGIANYPWPADAMGPHIKLIFPPHNIELSQCALANACAAGRCPFPMRTYTVRSFDPLTGELDIDFVMHGDGIASLWAARAQAGDNIGLWLREPRRRAHHDYYLLLGDLTALPAISQILEGLPTTMHGRAVIELADMADRQTIDCQADIEIAWVYPSAEMTLLQALQAHPWPRESRPFIWAGTEAKQAGAIRRYVRRSLGLLPADYSIVDYWTETETNVADP